MRKGFVVHGLCAYFPTFFILSSNIMITSFFKLLKLPRWAVFLGGASVLASCSFFQAPELPPRSTHTYQAVHWHELPAWEHSVLGEGWSAWLQSCQVLKNREGWRDVCAQSQTITAGDEGAIRRFFERQFQAYRLVDPDPQKQATGLVTGYYEPLLRGSLTPTETARYPIYGVPPELVASNSPRVAGLPKTTQSTRGRIEHGQFVPFYTSGEIAQGKGVERAPILAWAEDPVELMFLQIQGSGRIALPNGSFLRIGFADHNGHTFQSAARYLIQKGEMKAHEASMQGIQAWTQRNPHRIPELIAANPRYVFFRALPNAAPHVGPIGALGVPLTAEYSLAVDPKFTPLGAPIWLDTTQPLSQQTLRRLMFAQDTGSAIRGVVRADFFWGFGAQAGAVAGRMKQNGQMWLLLPKTMSPPNPS